MAGVEAAKKKLLSVATMTEDAAYSKLKNLLYTPLEEFVGDKAKQEAIGHALSQLGVASVLPIGALGATAAQGLAAGAAWINPAGLAAITVGAVVMGVLAAVGSDLERRARIEQGKTVTTPSRHTGESEGVRKSYRPSDPKAQAAIKKYRAR